MQEFEQSAPPRSSVPGEAATPYVARPGYAPTDPRRKSPMLAGLLSLMPGLGQVYVGYYQQGFVNILVIASVISIIATGIGPATPLAAFFVAFYWLFNIIDAARRAAFVNESLAGLGPLEVPENFNLPGTQGSLVAGVLMVALGGVALSHTVFGFSLDWLEDWWPLTLLVVGGWLIFQGIYQKAASK